MDNWVVQNLQNALNVWNEKLTDILQISCGLSGWRHLGGVKMADRVVHEMMGL